MAKHLHEIRDPIHVFVRLDSDERRVLDSRPFQRLRHIHQLGLSFLTYPGATHRRFEHSLGVMELAGRVFDVVTHPDALTDDVRQSLPESSNEDERRYWRRVVRMAALCHDIGHLPFSHVAEGLLPSSWNHEKLTREVIQSDEMQEIWGSVTPPLRPADIVKLAIGLRKAEKLALGLTFSVWETILSEIITGEAFGVDRMDYLLRDSHHAGVAYGRFDHFRLIDTLRILPRPPTDEESGEPASESPCHPETNPGRPPTDEESGEPALGVEQGGLQSAEGLLMARYFMYSQVYYHPVGRIYEIHLKDFLKGWLPDGRFKTDVEEHLRITDNEVMGAVLEAARNPKSKEHDPARRIVQHDHFRLLYRRTPDDVRILRRNFYAFCAHVMQFQAAESSRACG